jgi:4-hydroxysphinganine ceramide fatty acyl 2-hydroxylase
MSKGSLKNRRLRIFTADDLTAHNKKGDCWIVRNGKVYDVSAFVDDHPGGDDLILQYAGKDIGEAMDDPEEHIHSVSAYDMLDEYMIGKLGKDALVVDESEQLTFYVSHTSNHAHRLGG